MISIVRQKKHESLTLGFWFHASCWFQNVKTFQNCVQGTSIFYFFVFLRFWMDFNHRFIVHICSMYTWTRIVADAWSTQTKKENSVQCWHKPYIYMCYIYWFIMAQSSALTSILMISIFMYGSFSPFTLNFTMLVLINNYSVWCSQWHTLKV